MQYYNSEIKWDLLGEIWNIFCVVNLKQNTYGKIKVDIIEVYHK